LNCGWETVASLEHPPPDYHVIPRSIWRGNDYICGVMHVTKKRPRLEGIVAHIAEESSKAFGRFDRGIQGIINSTKKIREFVEENWCDECFSIRHRVYCSVAMTPARWVIWKLKWAIQQFAKHVDHPSLFLCQWCKERRCTDCAFGWHDKIDERHICAPCSNEMYKDC
jgi:hypothetical protein